MDRGMEKAPFVPMHASWMGEIFAIGYVMNVFVKF